MTTHQLKIFVQKGRAEAEAHLIFHADPRLSFSAQLDAILDDFHSLTHSELQGFSPVFMRFFLSDSFNQYACLKERIQPISCAVSIIEQPPLDSSKISLWVWMMRGAHPERLNNLWTVRDGDVTHLFSASSTDHSGVTTSKAQTNHLFSRYVTDLRSAGATLLHNCIRTWIFVQNVDVNYQGVVRARNEVFARHGLTPDTHFIASTGIQGRTADYNKVVSMDTYAVLGIKKEQVRFLSAPQFLGSTMDYGVAFERGTVVNYADRQRVFISGTASIDNKGSILHPSDVRSQAIRALQNVAALLHDAACDFSHLAHLIVYLRDVSDYDVINSLFYKRFPDVPYVILLAPVCRPGWLIEVECMAVK